MIRAKTTRSRYALTASIFIVFVVSVLLVIHVADILGQYRTYEYVVGLVFDSEVSPQAIAAQPIVGDKIIIVAKVENENTDWIEDLLPESDLPFSLVTPVSILIPMLQLATRYLPRQSYEHDSEGCSDDSNQQGPRSNGLLDLPSRLL